MISLERRRSARIAASEHPFKTVSTVQTRVQALESSNKTHPPSTVQKTWKATPRGYHRVSKIVRDPPPRKTWDELP